MSSVSGEKNRNNDSDNVERWTENKGGGEIDSVDVNDNDGVIEHKYVVSIFVELNNAYKKILANFFF